MNKEKPVSHSAHSNACSRQGIVPSHANEITCYTELFFKMGAFLAKKHPKSFDEASALFSNLVYNDQKDGDDAINTTLVSILYDRIIHARDIIKKGVSGIDLFLDKNRKLTTFEYDIIGKMAESWVSVFEMQTSDTHNVTFRDLVSGVDIIQRNLPEIEASNAQYIIGARIIPFSNHYDIGLSIFPFVYEDREYLLELIEEQWCAYKKLHPGSTIIEYLKAEDPVSVFVVEHLKAAIDQDHDFCEDEDEPMTLYLSVYRITDLKAVRVAMKTMTHLKKTDKDMYNWIVRSDDNEPVFMGGVLINENELILSVVNPEHWDAGKIMLQSALGTFIVHEFDTTEESSDEGEDDEENVF